MTPPRRWRSLVAMPASSPAKCSACSCARARGLVGVVGLLVAEIHAAAGHPPELESPGPAHLVELEVGAVARVAMEPAPDLHGRARVPHQGGDAVRPPGRHLVAPVGRAMAQSVGPIARSLDDGIGSAGSPVDAERAAGRSEMGVDEEEAEARVGEVLLDSAADTGARRAAPGLPWPPRPVGAFGHPACPGGRCPNSRRCSARPTASWSRMLSSRASSGRKPWVAAELMVSIRPLSSSERTAETMSPPRS